MDTLKGRYLIDGGGAAGATIGQVNASWKAFFGKLPPDSIAVETVRSGMCVRVHTRTHTHTHTHTDLSAQFQAFDSPEIHCKPNLIQKLG